MSQENVELVRRGYAAFGRGDVDGVLEVLDPELELSDPFGFSTTDAYRGHEGFTQTMRDALDAFERYEIETDEFIDAGDQIILSCRLSGVGRESGAIVNMRGAAYARPTRRLLRARSISTTGRRVPAS